MSVRYDLVFNSGKRISKNSVCFGSMSGNNFSDMYRTDAERTLAQLPATSHRFIQFFPAYHISPIWCYPFDENKRDWPRELISDSGSLLPNAKDAASKNFLEEMKILYDDMPLLHGQMTIHPLLGVVRSHIKPSFQSDKVMLSLFLIRNLCNYPDTAFSYRELRHKGYRPRLAAILAHLYATGSSSRISTANRFNQVIGEYNWINPDTFGKQAFLAFMNQGVGFGNYYQQPWMEQKGYQRDHHFAGAQRHVFDSRYRGSNWDFVSNDRHHGHDGTNIHTYWNMVDAYSIPGDEPILESMWWNPVCGFNIPFDPNTSKITQETFDSFHQGILDLCAENNINPYL